MTGEISNIEKGRSPFLPGRPVPPEMFVGRDAQVRRILRAVGQVRAGKQENLFVTGEYGIGKSSLIAYVRSLAQRESVVGFHVLLGGSVSLDDAIEKIVQRIVSQAHSDKGLARVKEMLGSYIGSVELFGVKVNTDVLRRDVPQIARNFLPFLRTMWKELRASHSGMALYLDDLNGITASPEFAALIKSLVDEIATEGEDLPLLLVLAGVPQRRLDILANQPSVERIFDIVEIDPMTDDEVRQFFVQAFESVGMPIHGHALAQMAHMSGGLPKLVHEIGDAVFWTDIDNRVGPADAVAGVMAAADAVGRKYFEPVRQALRSSEYQSILGKLGELGASETFSKADLAEGLTASEKRKLDNFLQRMKRLKALLPGDVRGQWKFPNRLLPVYLLMESRRPQAK